MGSAARSSYLDEEDHGERFVSPFKMEHLRNESFSQEEPVLKRAASVFFADLVASSTSSQENLGHLSYNESHNLNVSASFLRPPWDFQALEKPPPAGVLDPLLPTADEHQRALRELFCPNPVSQYHPVPPASEAGPGWKTFGLHLLDEDLHQYQYNLLSQSYGPPFPCACNESLKETPPVKAPQAAPEAGVEEVETRANDEVLELLYSRIPTHDQEEELEHDLEFGDFWDGLGSDKLEFLDSGHSMACGEDCQALVSSISNLSKVLLTHYSSKASNAPASSSHNNIRGLQSAILDLSKCLMHAHRQTAPVEEPAQVEEDKKSPEEHTFSGLYSGDVGDKKPEQKPDVESNEELMARFKVLLGLSEKKPDSSPEQSCVEDNFKVPEPEIEPEPEPEVKQGSSYLSCDQAEQRLALLKSRRNWNEEEEGVAKMGDEAIHVEDDYMGRAPEGEKIVYSAGVEKAPSDNEETGWEHI